MSAANMVLGTKAGDNTVANSSLRAYEQALLTVLSDINSNLVIAVAAPPTWSRGGHCRNRIRTLQRNSA